MTNLNQITKEAESKFDEKFKHSQFVDYSKIKSFLTEQIRTAVESALEATRLKNEDTPETYDKNCDCIQCYFINGFNQAVAEQAKKIERFMDK